MIPAANDLGMCHHFTWDGLHCVTHGLTSEHANRCAGRLCISGSAMNCKGVGGAFNKSCNRCKTNSAEVFEVSCDAPAQGLGTCHAETCPFVFEGGKCPYGGERPM